MPNTALNRTVAVLLTNKSGGALTYGAVVIQDTTTASSFTTTTTEGLSSKQIGVIIEPNGIANNASGMVAFAGYVPRINLDTTSAITQFIKTDGVAGQGTPHDSPQAEGDFAIALEASANPAAVLFGSPNAPGSGGGGGITALSGDISATGPGSVASTIQANSVTSSKTNFLEFELTRLMAGFEARGIYSGGVVAAQSVPDMTCQVSAGHIAPGGHQKGVLITAGNVTITAASTTQNRIDLVVANVVGGTLQVLAGTPAALPAPPSLANTLAVLAMVSVPANTTTITNSLITDKRVIGKWPQIIRLTATEQRVSTTTYLDTQLRFMVGSNEEWFANWNVFYDGADSTVPDMKARLTGPAGISGASAPRGMGAPASSFNTTQSNLAFGAATFSGNVVGTANTGFGGWFNYMIQQRIVSTTPNGEVIFGFAQNASSASAVTVRIGSQVIAYPRF